MLGPGQHLWPRAGWDELEVLAGAETQASVQLSVHDHRGDIQGGEEVSAFPGGDWGHWHPG